MSQAWLAVVFFGIVGLIWLRVLLTWPSRGSRVRKPRRVWPPPLVIGLPPIRSRPSEREQDDGTERRPKTFLAELAAHFLRVIGTGTAAGAVGKVLVADANGRGTWGYPTITTFDSGSVSAAFVETLLGADTAYAGEFLVALYIEVSAAGAAGKTLDITLQFTDDVGARNRTAIAAFAADVTTNSPSTVFVVRQTGAAGLDMTVAITGAGGEPTFRVFADVGRLR